MFNDKRYTEAFEKLQKNNTPVSWYTTEISGEKIKGMMWHFTDINNIVNILSSLKVLSKNQAICTKQMINDNAAEAVNTDCTFEWVHDYARFYLRPKTPTQYRNEGIYPKGADKSPKIFSRLFRGQEKWTDFVAHLPIPVFIGFSLKKALQKGAKITRGTLAGRRYTSIFEAQDNENFDFLCSNVEEIYGEGGSNSKITKIRHTEVVMKEAYCFDKNDILQIVVRTKAEKLMLMTALANANERLNSSKAGHDRIDFIEYSNRIIVDPTFFFYGSIVPCFCNEKIKFCYCRSYNNPTTFSDDEIYINTRPYAIKKYNNNMVVKKLLTNSYEIIDVNNNRKKLGQLNSPYFILSIVKWYGNLVTRYYSTIYLDDQDKVYRIYRDENKNYWYDSANRKLIELPIDVKQQLCKVEESMEIMN